MEYTAHTAELGAVTHGPGWFAWSDGNDNSMTVVGDRDELLQWLRDAADELNCTVEERDPGPDEAPIMSWQQYVGLPADPRDTSPTFARLMALLPTRDGSTRLTSDGL